MQFSARLADGALHVTAMDGPDAGRLVAKAEIVQFRAARLEQEGVVVGELSSIYGAELTQDVHNKTIRHLGVGKPVYFDKTAQQLMICDSGEFIRVADRQLVGRAERLSWTYGPHKGLITARGVE